MKPVASFENKYAITEDGDVLNIKTGNILNGSVGTDGYIKVTLTVSRREAYTVRRARLVCSAWHDNPENKPFVNHKNGNKIDDRPNNLEWSTAKENTQHAWFTGLCKPYDRAKPYNRQAIIDSNKRRAKNFGGVCGL